MARSRVSMFFCVGTRPISQHDLHAFQQLVKGGIVYDYMYFATTGTPEYSPLANVPCNVHVHAGLRGFAFARRRTATEQVDALGKLSALRLRRIPSSLRQHNCYLKKEVPGLLHCPPGSLSLPFIQ